MHCVLNTAAGETDGGTTRLYNKPLGLLLLLLQRAGELPQGAQTTTKINIYTILFMFEMSFSFFL